MFESKNKLGSDLNIGINVQYYSFWNNVETTGSKTFKARNKANSTVLNHGSKKVL